MRTYALQTICLIAVACPLVYTKIFILEAEQFVLGRKHKITRNEVLNGKSVILHQNDSLNIEFCLNRLTPVNAEYVRFSYNGRGHVVTFSVDELLIRTFHSKTVGDISTKWKVLRSLNLPNNTRRLTEGKHTFSIKVTQSNRHGVEIDFVTLDVDEEKNFSIRCTNLCFNHYIFPSRRKHDEIPNTKIVQQSYSSSCAEEDNINIQIYQAKSRQYTITAYTPSYRTFINNRHADFENCAMLLSVWNFTNISTANDRPVKIQHETAILETSETRDMKYVSIYFRFVGLLAGSGDSEIGSNISLKITESSRHNFINFTIGANFYGRENTWSNVVNSSVSGSGVTWWVIPDHTWDDEHSNVVRFYIPTNANFNIEYIKMVRREQKQDKKFVIFSDARVIIEGVDIDFWWMAKQPMTVRRIDNGEDFVRANYIRIYKRIPWEERSYSQVFVMYQDGNVRLLPITPHGLDWIPFGSSLLVGETDPDVARPYASVDHIDIDPRTLVLYIRYKNGGTATMDITISLRNTSVNVRDLVLKGDRLKHPLLTFRSMWVSDRNNDVDHVSVDGNRPRPILSGWRELYGTAFTFFRKCISNHNSLSPDIHIQFGV